MSTNSMEWSSEHGESYIGSVAGCLRGISHRIFKNLPMEEGRNRLEVRRIWDKFLCIYPTYILNFQIMQIYPIIIKQKYIFKIFKNKVSNKWAYVFHFFKKNTHMLIHTYISYFLPPKISRLNDQSNRNAFL